MKYKLTLISSLLITGIACSLLFLSTAWSADLQTTIKDVTDALGMGKNKRASSSSSPDNDKTSLGLKEALLVGIQNAVKKAGSENGFYKNDAIKILLPENLEKADSFIRQLGGDQLSDAFIKKMNLAAEKSAPQALDIFSRSIKEIKIDDAVKLLSARGNAATEYLEGKTSESLKSSFYPVVKITMEELGAVKLYNEYIGKYESNPLLKMAGLEIDINKYVTDKTIDGLFLMVADEEGKIRKNPEARITDLLKDVFGK
ncbi:DUF4197 domain-containing protein [Desulfobacterales bacterium HSG17]|nr:DUF4197 domain-containing protein [Desulfobacterales bacterium HSG17]